MFTEPVAAEDLTEEERARKAELESQGKFGHWGKREFQAFIRGCETYGRHAYDLIAQEVEQKTPEEVAAYGKVFWQRYKELEGTSEHALSSSQC